jgi:hypothetical protein
VGQWVSGSVDQWVSELVVALGHDCMDAWMHGEMGRWGIEEIA